MPAIADVPSHYASESGAKESTLLPSQQLDAVTDQLLRALESIARPGYETSYNPLSQATVAMVGHRELVDGKWFQLASTTFSGSRSMTATEAQAYREFRRSKYRR